MENNGTGMKKQNEIPVQIFSDINQLKTESADLVNFEVFNGRIIFNFLQTYPNMLPPLPDTAENQQPQRMAKIATRVSIPWDHFVRLIPSMIDIAQKNCDDVSQSFHEAVKIIEEIGKKQAE